MYGSSAQCALLPPAGLIPTGFPHHTLKLLTLTRSLKLPVHRVSKTSTRTFPTRYGFFTPLSPRVEMILAASRHCALPKVSACMILLRNKSYSYKISVTSACPYGSHLYESSPILCESFPTISPQHCGSSPYHSPLPASFLPLPPISSRHPPSKPPPPPHTHALQLPATPPFHPNARSSSTNFSAAISLSVDPHCKPPLVAQYRRTRRGCRDLRLLLGGDLRFRICRLGRLLGGEC